MGQTDGETVMAYPQQSNNPIISEEPIPGTDGGSLGEGQKSSQEASQGVSEAPQNQSANDFPVPASSSPTFDLPDGGGKAPVFTLEDDKPQDPQNLHTKKEALAAVYNLESIVGSGESPEKAYFDIAQELDDVGKSDRLHQIKVVLGDKYVEQSKNAARTIIEDSSINQKDKMDALHGIAQDIDKGLNTVDMMMDTATAKAIGQQPEAVKALNQYYDTAQDIRRNVLEFMQSEYASDLTFEGDWLQKASAFSQYYGGVVNMSLPWVPGVDIGYNEGMRRFQKAFEPEGSKAKEYWNSLAPGELVNEVQSKLESLKGKEKEKYAQRIIGAFRKMREGISVAGTQYKERPTHYTLQDQYLMSEIFSPYLEGEGFSGFDRAVMDSEGALSTLPVAALVLRAVKGVARGAVAVKNSMRVNSMADKMRDINPEEARAVQNRLIATGDDEVATNFTGMSIDQQLEAMLYPKTSDGAGNASVEAFDPMALMSNPAFFSKEEAQRTLQAQADVIQNEKLSGAVIQEGNIILKQDERGVPIVSALYGEDKGKGFTSLDDAKETMSDLFGKNAGVTYLKETKDGLKLAEDGYEGKVFARIDRASTYDPFTYRMIEGEELSSTGSHTFGADRAAMIARTPLETLPRGRGSMFERGGAAQYRLSRLESMFGGEALGKVLDLSNASIKKLDQVLIDVGGKDLSGAAVKSQYGLNQKEYEAFSSIHRHQDNMYLLNNYTEYNKLKTKGAQTVVVGEREFTASPTSWDKLKERETFYMIGEDGVPVKINRSNAKNLEDVNWFRTRKATEEVPGGSVVAFSNKANAQYKPLSPKQLNYISNYYTRMYDMNYVVRAWDKTTGEPLGAIAGAKSKKRAIELVDDLKQNYPNYTLEQTRALEMAPADLDSAITSGSANRGLFFSKRQSEALINADTLPPIESLVRSSNIMARRMSTRAAIDIDIDKWAKTFGDKATIIKDGKPMFLKDHPGLQGDSKRMPSMEEIRSANWDNPRDKADALYYANDINNRSGARNLAERRAMANKMLSIAEGLERNGVFGQWLSKALYDKAGDLNIISDIRRYNFYTLLALNPQRQFVLQAAQPLFIAGIATRDFIPGIAKGQQLFYWYGRYLRNKDFMPANAADKELFKSAIESGVFQNIAHHTYARDVASGISSGKAGEQSMRLAGQIFQGIRRVGFDAGEAQNQAMTYAIVARQYKRENPGVNLADREHVDAISSRVREYTLSMDQRGEPGYANGLWSIPLQFMSIQHKAMMAWMPKALGGNKYFSGPQKAGIFASQITLFGAEGVGMKKLVDPIFNDLSIDGTDENYVAAYGGLIDLGFLNLTGDDLNISGSFAPGGSGIPNIAEGVGKTLTNMIMYGKSPTILEGVEAALGPTGSSASKLIKMWNSISYMSDAHKGPMNFSKEDWELLAHRLGTTFSSGYSNYIKSKMAYYYGFNYSMNTGKGYSTATGNEALAKFIGIGTHREEDTFDAISKMIEESDQKYTPSAAESDGREAAKIAISLFLRRLQEHGVIGKDGNRYTAKDLPRPENGQNFDQALVIEKLATNYLQEEIHAADLVSAHIDDPLAREQFRNAFAKQLGRGVAGGEYPVMESVIEKMMGGGSKEEVFFHQLQKLCRASGNKSCDQKLDAARQQLKNTINDKEYLKSIQDLREEMK